MARLNIQIKVGTYTGNGVDSTNVTGIGFRPDLLMVKGGANIAYIRTNFMRGDSSALTVGASVNAANVLQELLNDGFQVGTAAASNSNGTAYYYVAIRGTAVQSYFRTGRYYGDGVDNRNFTTGGLNFTPDVFCIKGDTAQQSAFRIAAITGDNATTFSNTTGSSNIIQNLQSNGVQLGTNARVNSAGAEYHFFALKHLTGVITSGRFTGDGLDNKAITGLGFSPDVLIVKNESTTDAAVIYTSSMAEGDSFSMNASAAATDMVKSRTADGFTLGTNAAVNGSGNTISYIALKSGNFNAPVTRTAV